MNNRDTSHERKQDAPKVRPLERLVIWPRRWLARRRERREVMAWFDSWRKTDQASQLRYAIERGDKDASVAFLMLIRRTDAMQAFRDAIEEGRTARAAAIHAHERVKAR